MIDVAYFLLILVLMLSAGAWSILLPITTLSERYFLFQSVLMGFLTMVLAGTWLSYLGLDLNTAARPLVAMLAAAGLGALYLRRRQFRIILRASHRRETYCLMVLAGTGGLLVLAPVLLFGAFFPYGDGFTYVAVADFLMERSYFDEARPEPYAPWLTQMKIYQDNGFRIGSLVFLAHVGAFLGLKFSINAYMPLLAAAHAQLIVIVFLFCRTALNLGILAAMVAASFAALHVSLLINNLWLGFLPQSFGLVIFLYALTLMGMDKKAEKLDTLGHHVVACSGLALVYSELLPFLSLTYLIFVVTFSRHNRSRTLAITRHIVLVAIGAAVLSNYGLYTAAKAILTQLGAIVGWNVTYTAWDYVSVIFSQHTFVDHHRWQHSSPFYYLLSLAMSLSLLTMVFHGLKQLRDVRAQLAQYGVVFGVLMVYFAIFAANPWIGGDRGQTWSLYKLVGYAFILVPPAVGLGVAETLKLGGRPVFIWVVATCLVYVGSSLFIMRYTAKEWASEMISYTGSPSPLDEYISLPNAIPKDIPVHLDMPERLQRHQRMVAYFLRDFQVSSTWYPSDQYVHNYTVPTPSVPQGATELTHNQSAVVRIANLLVSSGNVRLEYVSGVYDRERGETSSWNWAIDEPLLRLVRLDDAVESGLLQFGLSSVSNKVTEVTLVEPLGKETTYELEPGVINYFAKRIDLTSSEQELRLRYAGETMLEPGGTRTLSFAIYDLSFMSDVPR